MPGNVDLEYVKKLATFLNDLELNNQIAVVTGGGKLARKYIEVAREMGASETVCDLIGIDASRMNARIVSIALGDKSVPEPPTDFLKAREWMEAKKIVVMGGTHPGHSTDAVAALLAEYIGAELLINASDVDGIYDRDPQEYSDARLYEEIHINDLLEILQKNSVGAGEYRLMDILAAKIIERSSIRTIFLNGKDIDNMRQAIGGRKFKGTLVKK